MITLQKSLIKFKTLSLDIPITANRVTSKDLATLNKV